MRKRKVLAGLLLPSVLVLAACGSDDPDEATDTETTGSAGSAAECIEETASGGGSGSGEPGPVLKEGGVEGVTVTGEPGSEPTVKIETPLSVDETQIAVRAKGDGPEVPADATVTFNYAGYNARTGKMFDSSWTGGQPASAPLDGLIAGFSEAIAGQPAGSQVVVAVAPDDGYGPSGGNPNAGIKADDTIVFVLDVVKFSTVLDMAAGTVQEAPETMPTVLLDESCVPTGFEAGPDVPDEVTESSVATLVEGDGAKVEKGQQITVHYLGHLYPDGEKFDGSWEGGQPATFGIGTGQVIGCWDDLVPDATVGSRLELVCTPEDAYGDQDYNGIPGGSTLTFVVDVLGAS